MKTLQIYSNPFGQGSVWHLFAPSQGWRMTHTVFFLRDSFEGPIELPLGLSFLKPILDFLKPFLSDLSFPN